MSKQENRIGIGIVLVTLVLDALFFAQGVTGLLASSLLPLETGGDTVVTGGSARAARGVASQHADATTILRRNIFDSETGPLDGTRVADVTPDEETPDEPLDPNAPLPRCEGSVRLVGALVNDRNREWSFAAITDATGKALLYREGMTLDGKTLLEIRSSNIVMRATSGNACQLAMFDNTPEGAAPPRAVARVTAPPEPGDDGPPTAEGEISAADMESGITRVSDTQFTVSRSLVDQLLENQAELMRTARIIPHEENGRTVGVKLYGIRRNSILGRLGLQNGDMLRTINGYDMTSPDSALEAYSRLRSATNLSVNVVRRGEATSLDYNIQ